MVDYKVRHDFNLLPEGIDILPAAQTGIDTRGDQLDCVFHGSGSQLSP